MRYGICITTYTALDHCKRCLESVFAHSSDFELCLTSNGNPVVGNYFLGLARDHPNVTVVINQKNEGFINPSRVALTKITSHFVIYLNDDTTVDSGWLEALERPFKEFQMCALSSPVGGHFRKSLNPDKSAIEYLWGHCMMGRTELLKEVGLFSDYLKFCYWEEIDLGLRLIEKGYTLHVTPDCRVTHIGKATSSKMPGINAIEQRNFHEVARRFPMYFGRRVPA